MGNIFYCFIAFRQNSFFGFHNFSGGYGWFGIHTFNPDECNPQQEQKPVTLSDLLPSEEGSLSAVREQWLVAISSIRQVLSNCFLCNVSLP